MQRSLSMERNGIPLCFTMFNIRLLYPIIARIKYDVKDLKYIKNYFKNGRVAAFGRPQPYGIHVPHSKQIAKTTYDAATR